MRKIALFFLVLFIIFPYTRPRYGGNLKVELPISGNPVFWDNLIKDSLIYVNLFYLNAGGKVGSFIFSRWWNEENKWYFQLREGLLYGDGTPVLPRDVANSINSFINGNEPGALALKRAIVSIGVKPPDQVIIETSAQKNLPLLLSTPYLFLKKEDKSSGPFLSSGVDTYKANPFFAGGRPFLDSVTLVYPPQIPDLSFTQGISPKPVSSFKYMVYLLVSPRKWRKLSRRAIFSLLSAIPWEKKADSYLPSQLSQFSVDFPVLRLRKVRGLIRRKIIISVSPVLSMLIPEIEKISSLARVKVEVKLSEDPLDDLFSGRCNAALFPSQAVFVGSEGEELVGMINQYRLSNFYPYLTKLSTKLTVLMGKDERKLQSSISSTYEYIASREFFFPLAMATQPVYLNESFLWGGVDFYGRPLLWRIRRALRLPHEGKTSSSTQNN